jgi:hypothetical protein
MNAAIEAMQKRGKTTATAIIPDVDSLPAEFEEEEEEGGAVTHDVFRYRLVLSEFDELREEGWHEVTTRLVWGNTRLVQAASV